MSCNDNNITIYINFFDIKSGKIRVQQKSVVILKGEDRFNIIMPKTMEIYEVIKIVKLLLYFTFFKKNYN